MPRILLRKDADRWADFACHCFLQSGSVVLAWLYTDQFSLKLSDALKKLFALA
jgi:hypothetical protein